MSTSPKERQILGVKFFIGDVSEVIAKIETGGLLVAPSAPSFLEIVRNPEYRESVLNADMAITDSALMVALELAAEGFNSATFGIEVHKSTSAERVCAQARKHILGHGWKKERREEPRLA